MLEQDLLLDRFLVSVLVKKTRDHYFVATNYNGKKLSRYLRKTSSSYGSQSKEISGWVYAFHRQTGRMAWADPVKVANFDLHMLAPDNPFVIFARRIDSQKHARNRKTRMEFSMLDTRVGEFVVYETFDYNVAFTSTTFDSADMSLSAVVGANVFKLELTDQPRPPRPKSMPVHLKPPADWVPENENSEKLGIRW